MLPFMSATVELRTTSRSHTAGLQTEAVSPCSVLDRAGVKEGQPFILGADGSYDLHLNRFLRELDSWGVSADNSIKGYSRDVMLFCRFLSESRNGKSIWECDGEDLRAYKRVRLFSGPDSVSVGTWNRSIAALDKWVAWSRYEELLTKAPFRYVDKTVMTHNGPRTMQVNTEYVADPEDEPVRFVSFEDYLLWRDVGLRGDLPEGGRDPRWRGRNGERNAMFADLIVYTGMRLSESSSLLVPEVPPLVTGRRITGDVHLSKAVTKRNKARTVFMTVRMLRSLHHFIDIERDELVARRLAEGAYASVEDTLLVRRAGRHALTLDTGRGWAYAKIGSEERRRLAKVCADGSTGAPLWLWLGEDGRPLSPATWQSAFRRANERCAKFGIDLVISPHILRHVYAVHMLGLLLRQTIRALGRREDQCLTRAELRRLLVGNPMRKLQQLLGHAHESTVYVYLDVLDEAQEIVLAAMAEWDAQAAVLDRLEVAA
ncbi:tyrosine-type recombinase/integrase [Embleya sp. NPDC055664]